MLLAGVAACLALEIAGIAVYWRARGHLAISSQPAVYLSSEGFFPLLGELFRHGAARQSGLGLMTAGIVVLILTPLARVVASLAYFAWRRDAKYLFLTSLVLVILVVSLALH
jgi:uncharacterized membrane protein